MTTPGQVDQGATVSADFFARNTQMEIHKELMNSRPVTGRVEWIGVAAERMAPMQVKTSVQLIEQAGIEGEHHARPGGSSKRQVTLIQHEHLSVIQSLLDRKDVTVSPELLRRNLVVSGINLNVLRHSTFRIGTALLKGTGSCPPCSRMDANLGKGGYAAMVGHGGITAIVLENGSVTCGDSVRIEITDAGTPNEDEE